GLQAWLKLWIPAHAIDAIQQLRAEEFVLGHVNPVTGCEQDMIEDLLACIARCNPNLAGNCDSRLEVHVGAYLDTVNTVLQPPSTRGTYGAAVRPFLKTARQFAEVIRSCHQLAESRRSNVSWRIKQATQRFDLGYLPLPSQPMHVRLAYSAFHIGAGLAQQRGCLQSTLSTAYYQNTLARKTTQVVGIRAMRSQVSRQSVKHSRAIGECRDASSYDYAARVQDFAVFRFDHEAIPVTIDLGDFSPVEAGRSLLLKPVTVVHEPLQGDGSRHVVATSCYVRIQRQSPCGI